MGVDSRAWMKKGGAAGTGGRRGRERSGMAAAVLCAVACAIALVSCAAKPQVSEREVRMRYVNLNLIFEYMVRSDPDAQKVRRQKEDLLGSAKKLEAELAGRRRIPQAGDREAPFGESLRPRGGSRRGGTSEAEAAWRDKQGAGSRGNQDGDRLYFQPG